MPSKKKFKWTVEFTIDKTWVEDGFILTPERAKDMIENTLPYSYSDETRVKVISAPPIDEILKVLGYDPKSMTKKQKAAAMGS